MDSFPSLHQYGTCISTPVYQALLESSHQHYNHHSHPSLSTPSIVPSHIVPSVVPRATSYNTARRALEETSHNSVQTPPSQASAHLPTPTSPQNSNKKIHAKLDQKRRSRGARIHGTVAAPSHKTLAAAVQQDLVPYHQYRARQRRDASMEGESVWDEELEEAFMEGKFV